MILKILSWNIRQGGGSRIPAILSALKASGCHMAILSEFRNHTKG